MRTKPLTNEMARNADEYWTRGYTIVRGVYDDVEIATLRAECDRLWTLPGLLDDLNLRSEFRRNVDGSYVADRLDPVLDLSRPLLDAVLAPKLAGILASVLGATAQLLKCKLIRKDPGTGGYAHHQDFLYWRWLNMPPDALCSVGIPLYTSDREHGGIEFFPGYHQSLLPGTGGNLDADFDIEHIDLKTGEVPTVEPGDVLLFHSLAPHRSAANLGAHSRTLILPSFAVSDRRDLYRNYYKREVARRCAEHVGFEHFDVSLSEIDRLQAAS
jgi:ectoine hydroxylase-related dioxygenase (phytanoyl-CoA dioxygenase family)